MENINMWSLIGKIILTVFSVLLALNLKEYLERKKEITSASFEVYMKLLDLSAAYDRIVSSFIGSRKYPESSTEFILKKSFEITDKIRSVDNVLFQDEIVEVLMDTTIANNPSERIKLINNLIEKMGEKINPKYHKKIKEISSKNVQILMVMDKGNLNTPGIMDQTRVWRQNRRIET